MTDLACTLAALFVHPIKSCIALDEALLVETGLDLDRAWMVVDTHGDMLTQREWPRLALVQPTLKGHEMVLRAPGMLALHVRLDTVEAAARVRVWDDVVKAFDMGALAAQWFSDFIGCGQRLRLDVHLADDDPARELAGEFLDGRRQRLAGSAPRRPEIDEHRLRVVHHG